MEKNSALPSVNLHVGDIVADRYRIERLLGQGGMGVILVATREQLGDQVAMKLLRSEMLAHPGAAERFLREARTMVRFRSEHVARVLDVGSLPTGEPFFVMELLEGMNFEELIATSAPMAPSRAAQYALQAARAVGEAHAQGTVHRDVKPTNLFLARQSDGRSVVKVLDFGIAKAADLESGDASLTRSREFLGSPLYMSPEQVDDARTAGPPTDVWALGSVLFEMLTGRAPFMADSPTKVLVSIASRPAPAMLSVRPDLPPELGEIVDACLARDPAQRPCDGLALVARLEDCIARLPSATDTASGPRVSIPAHGSRTLDASADTMAAPVAEATTARQTQRKRSPRLALLVGAVAVLGAAASYGVIRVSSPAAVQAGTAPVSSEPASTAVPVAPVAEAPSASSSATPVISVPETSATVSAVRKFPPVTKPAAQGPRPPAPTGDSHYDPLKDTRR